MGRDFEGSSWADKAFAANYLSRADLYIPCRGDMFAMFADMYKELSGDRRGLTVCDIGCGDGALMSILLAIDPTIKPALVDASAEMLRKASERLSQYHGAQYIEAGFEEILAGVATLPESDFFVSSMAIHHLAGDDKRALMAIMHGRLRPGGWFVNVETIKPPTDELERIHFNLWSRQMGARMSEAGVTDETPADVIARYKSPASNNRPDTLGFQLDALSRMGYVNVDCFYKNTVFAIYAAQRAALMI